MGWLLEPRTKLFANLVAVIYRLGRQVLGDPRSRRVRYQAQPPPPLRCRSGDTHRMLALGLCSSAIGGKWQDNSRRGCTVGGVLAAVVWFGNLACSGHATKRVPRVTEPLTETSPCSVLSVEHGNSRPGFATSSPFRPRLSLEVRASWLLGHRPSRLAWLGSEVTPDIEDALAHAGRIGVPEPRYSGSLDLRSATNGRT